MSINRSGKQDRRGFDVLLKLHMGLAAGGLVLIIFYSWKLGLAVMMYGCVAFITMEVVSSPPLNNPENFKIWVQSRSARRPVLLCLGDSLTHGTCSANFTNEIPFKVSEALGLPAATEGSFFWDPIWVVNAGQNAITSHTILRERLHSSLSCYPDFIFIMIGTNDVRAMYNPSWAKRVVNINELPETPTMRVLERNLAGILDFLNQSSPLSRVAIATLPPMGENLQSRANDLIREANEIIKRVAANAEGKVVVVPVYEKLEELVEKEGRRGSSVSIDFGIFLSVIMCPLYYVFPGIVTWDRLSRLVGHKVLTDGLHLNERARDEVVAAIVDWLVKANVAKAIAVKQI